MKLTKEQINIIIENTPKELKGFHNSIEKDLGYHTPSNANWSYCAGYVRHNSNLILVVKVFGEIK